MTRPHFPRTSSMVLAASLAIALPSTILAQVSRPSNSTGGNSPISSGSGSTNEAGSSTGSGGTSATGSATTLTGSGLGTRTGSQGFSTGQPGGPGVPPMGVGRSPDAGPGGGSHLPDDPALIPLEAFQGMAPLELGKMAEVTTIDPRLIRRAREITDPSERSLALQRMAAAAIFSNELAESHHALTEAASAALELPPSLIRDQRLIAIITTLLALADADLREGKVDVVLPDLAEVIESTRKVDRDKLIRKAELEWRRAAHLALLIANPTYRAELTYRVVENAAAGSQTIATEYLTDGGTKPGVKDSPKSYEGLADSILSKAAQESLVIERPVWRDRALVAVAAAAAASRQFNRALEVARMIPQPEVRSDALMKIAEAQSRSNKPDAATATYEEAAQSISAIPLDDPRAVLIGVLIDNLISVGRFEDARASVALYPDEPRRLIALGAIAYSQGKRGAGDSARDWIARDVPEKYRAQLYRQVADGIVWAVEQNRSRAMSGRSER